MVAAFGGAVPFGGCVDFVGGFAGPGTVEGVCSLLPSEEAEGVLGAGFTSPSCACSFGGVGVGAGVGLPGVCA